MPHLKISETWRGLVAGNTRLSVNVFWPFCLTHGILYCSSSVLSQVSRAQESNAWRVLWDFFQVEKNFFCFPVFHWSAQLFDTFTILFYYNKAAAFTSKRRLKTKKWTYFWWFAAKQKLWKKSSVQLIKNLPQNVVSKFIGPIFIHTCLEKLLGLPYLPDFMSP